MSDMSLRERRCEVVRWVDQGDLVDKDIPWRAWPGPGVAVHPTKSGTMYAILRGPKVKL